MFTIEEAVNLFLTGDFCAYCCHEGQCGAVCRRALTDLVHELVKDGIIKQKLIIMDASGNRCQDFTMSSLCYAAEKVIKFQKAHGEESELETTYFENFAQQKLKSDVRMQDVYDYMLNCKDRTFAMELFDV